MSKPTIRIHDLATGEIVDREMNVAEYKVYEAELKVELAKQAEAEEKAQAKAALLDRLGISEDEAKLLFS